MNITFVSALFHIGRQESNFNDYYIWSEKLLELPINLYFFTSKEIHDKLRYKPRDNLKFVILDKIPFFDKLPLIEEIWKKYFTYNTEKDTAKFACFTHSKFYFLKQSIEDNPFNTTHYGWIDAGLSKIATDMHLLPYLIPSDKVKFLYIGYTNKDEVKDEAVFINAYRARIAAGLITGPKDNLQKFIHDMSQLQEDHLNKHIFGLEQEYMTILYCRNPELFDTYYGRYEDIIINYNGFKRDSYHLKHIINCAKNDKEEYEKILQYMATK